MNLNSLRLTLACSAAAIALAGCSNMDIDLRSPQNGFSTSEAARTATAERPRPDARGVITYPDYQVAIAQSGDSLLDVAQRVGVPVSELARINALTPDIQLRGGEVLALPGGGAGMAPSTGGGSEIAITTLAENAILRAEGGAQANVQPAAAQPVRHQVQRGETAFGIARLYNVTPRALSDWNGLGPEMTVREGQVLLIPVPQSAQPPAPAFEQQAAMPGAGSVTPVPPSASTPLPEPEPPVATATEQARAAQPPSPNLAEDRSTPPATGADASAFIMPVQGRIIRAYAPGRNEGIGIAASAGTEVRAAAAGTVAAITQDTNNVPIVVIRHDNGLLSVYANLDNLRVERGARVSRGQTIATVRAGDPSSLHFEIRDGMNSVDPMTYIR